MPKYYLIILFSLFAFHSFAQAPQYKIWDARFGTSYAEVLMGVTEAVDGGFILGGSTNSTGIGGDKTQPSRGDWDYWIVKVDSLGNKQWDKRYGGSSSDEMFSLCATVDKGFILGGTSKSGIGGDKSQPTTGNSDYWLVKIDSLGNKQWDKAYSRYSGDLLRSVQQTKDKGYIIGGLSSSPNAYWVVKTDSAGNILWDKTIAVSFYDKLGTVRETLDGGFILGATKSNYGYRIIRFDSAGTIKWDKIYYGNKTEQLLSLQVTADNGFIVAGFSNAGIAGMKTEPCKGVNDIWMLKIDSLGNKQWDRDLGGSNNEYMDHLEGGDMMITTDKGYLLATNSSSDSSGDKSEDNPSKANQLWIVKTDSLGNKQWDKTVFTASNMTYGRAIETKDGGYAVANSDNYDSPAGGYKSQVSRGEIDYWVAKFRYSTVQGPVCDFTLSKDSICLKNCINVTNLSTGVITQKWSIPAAPNVDSTQFNLPAICFNDTGHTYISLMVSDGHQVDLKKTDIYVSPLPKPVITRVNDTLYCKSLNGVSYQWLLDGVTISGATSNFTKISGKGTYSVRVRDSSTGCFGESTFFVLSTGIASVNQAPYQLYPNPTTGLLTVNGNPGALGDEIVITNILGCILIAQPCRGAQQVTVDVSELPGGVYFITTRSLEKPFTQKFIKQ